MIKSFQVTKEGIIEFRKIEGDYQKIPPTSGIYIFYDKQNQPLYVGKASTVRARISTHIENYRQLIRNVEYLRNFIKENTSEEITVEYKNKDSKFWRFARWWKPQSLIVIEQVMDKVVRIEIDELPKNKITLKELDYIVKLEPTFNSQVEHEEYTKLQINLNEFQNFLDDTIYKAERESTQV
jgi:hypothetical protein